MNSAKLVKKLPISNTGTIQSLYQLSPPLEAKDWDDNVKDVHEYVVVSAVNAMDTGAETYIFPADSEGKITDWLELDGSFKGALDHAEALANAGYEIKE